MAKPERGRRFEDAASPLDDESGAQGECRGCQQSSRCVWSASASASRGAGGRFSCADSVGVLSRSPTLLKFDSVSELPGSQKRFYFLFVGPCHALQSLRRDQHYEI